MVKKLLQSKAFKLFLLACVLLVILVALLLSFKSTRRYLFNLGALNWAISAYNSYRPTYISMQNDEDCFLILNRQEVQFEKLANQKHPKGCDLNGTIRVSKLGNFYLSSPAIMTCQLALHLQQFTKNVVNPRAQEYFGADIQLIEHIGTYNCRSGRGMKSILSEHAFANAIDILGFTTSKGEKISVENHWTHQGNRGKFLHEIGSKACDHFSIALGPNYDRNHHNHFHFDMAPFSYCGH